MAQNFNVHIQEGKGKTGFYGVYDSLPGDQIPPGYFYKVDNAFCSDNAIRRVPGSTAINTSIASRLFNGFTAFEIPSASVKYLVVSINGASNAQLYKSTGGNFSTIGSANLTNSLPVWFETANNIVFGFNGTEEIDWDGTTVTKNRSNVPLGFYAEWFHNYLFVANSSSSPNRLWWSALGDPTNWSSVSTQFVDINPGDGDQIMGLSSFPGQDELLIFKRNTIWSVTGFSGASFSTTTAATQNTNARIVGYGCIAPFSIVPVGNDVYFFSMLGSTPVIRSLTKTINAVTLGGGIISDTIRGTLANINLSAISSISGGFDGRYVYWGVPTGSSTYNNQIIALDTWEITKGSIYPFTTMSGKNPAYFSLSTIPGYPLMYFADASSNGLVFKFDTSLYTDNGSPNTIDVQTRDYNVNASNDVKWFYGFMSYDTGSAASVAVNARIDRATNFTNQATISMKGNSPGLGSFILGSSLLGGQGTTNTRWGFQQVQGHNMGLEFKDTTINNVVIHDWEIWGTMKKLRTM